MHMAAVLALLFRTNGHRKHFSSPVGAHFCDTVGSFSQDKCSGSPDI